MIGATTILHLVEMTTTRTPATTMMMIGTARTATTPRATTTTTTPGTASTITRTNSIPGTMTIIIVGILSMIRARSTLQTRTALSTSELSRLSVSPRVSLVYNKKIQDGNMASFPG